MNLHSQFAWVRAAGLVAAIGLGACDSGAPATTADAKKAEPAKMPEPTKIEPAKTEPAKTEPVPDAKTADTAAPDAKAADTAGDSKAPDAAADTKAADAKDTKAADAKPDAKKPDAKDAKDAKTPAIDAKPLYDKHCKSCHAPDGKGTPAMKKKNIPDLTDKAWQTAHSKAKVVDALNKGVPGTPMKDFKAKLKPEEMDAVAAFVKKMK
jgi:mono/diheme cytochrome c family protein